MTRWRFRCLVWLAVVAMARAAAVAVVMLGPSATTYAQPRPTPDDDLFAFFYTDPRPERLVGYLERLEATPEFGNWQAHPPMAGFFAVVFSRYPDWIERLTPARPSPLLIETLAAALELSGDATLADDMRARSSGASGVELRRQFANLPTSPADLKISIPTHLDILWGASFASGDGRYARQIIDFLADTANESEEIALDIAHVTLAIMSGTTDTLQGLPQKYGDETTIRILYAATALWALQSNADRHAFIDDAAKAYVKAHSNTPTARLISAILR